MDRCPGGRVASAARRTVADGELAEPGDRHLTAVGQFTRDRIEYGVDGTLRLTDTESTALRDLASELVLRHDTPLRWADAGSKLAPSPDVQEFRCAIDARIWGRLRASRGSGRPIAAIAQSTQSQHSEARATCTHTSSVGRWASYWTVPTTPWAAISAHSQLIARRTSAAAWRRSSPTQTRTAAMPKAKAIAP